MPDQANENTEREILRIEKRLAEEYARAEKELKEKIDDYYNRFRKKDATWKTWVERGTKTQEEYRQWRLGQLAVGKRWEGMKDEIAKMLSDVNRIAREIVSGRLPGVYADNFNWGTYEIENGAEIDTGFILYDESAVARALEEDPNMLPDPGRRTEERIRLGLEVRYNKQKLQSLVVQAILQGDSIPEIAGRISMELGESNHKAAIRNARTAMTAAQNAGRIDSYNRAREMGIDVQKCWVATLDQRTRHAHRQLDGVSMPVNKPFKNEFGEIMYPGDPNATGVNIYNCRCTLISKIKGFEIDTTAYRHDRDIGGMSYEEWKAERKAKSNPIERQEKMGQAIRMAHIANYRRG